MFEGEDEEEEHAEPSGVVGEEPDGGEEAVHRGKEGEREDDAGLAEGFTGAPREDSDENDGPQRRVELDEYSRRAEAMEDGEFEVIAWGGGGLVV